MKPMLATRGDHVPQGREWIHEVKWDGIRALVEVMGGRLRITTRNENEVSVAYPELGGIADLGHDLEGRRGLQHRIHAGCRRDQVSLRGAGFQNLMQPGLWDLSDHDRKAPGKIAVRHLARLAHVAAC